MAARTLSPLSARTVRSDLRLSRERMARLFDVSAKTIERWEAAGGLPASSHARERLGILRQIADLGLTVYTPDGLEALLGTPLAHLGGRTPLQAIEQGESERVLALLASDYEGLGA